MKKTLSEGRLNFKYNTYSTKYNVSEDCPEELLKEALRECGDFYRAKGWEVDLEVEKHTSYSNVRLLKITLLPGNPVREKEPLLVDPSPPPPAPPEDSIKIPWIQKLVYFLYKLFYAGGSGGQ